MERASDLVKGASERHRERWIGDDRREGGG